MQRRSNLFKFFKKVLVLLIVFFSLPTLAWNRVGHELVAQIAYDQLTSEEKSFWQARIRALAVVYPKKDFVRSSTLPDELKQHGVNAFNSWHYIDLPIFLNKVSVHYFIDPKNIIWALNQSIQVEQNAHATPFEKAFFASFIIHLVADIHQPLHCVSLFNTHFPRGDRGGNLFIIKNRQWHNLHVYWDDGGGFLTSNRVYPSKMRKITAKKLEKKYPLIYFGSRINIVNPKVWSRESQAIAKEKVYVLSEHTYPSEAYQQETQRITEEQIVLAGYRLARLLHLLTF